MWLERHKVGDQMEVRWRTRGILNWNGSCHLFEHFICICCITQRMLSYGRVSTISKNYIQAEKTATFWTKIHSYNEWHPLPFASILTVQIQDDTDNYDIFVDNKSSDSRYSPEKIPFRSKVMWSDCDIFQSHCNCLCWPCAEYRVALV